MLPFVYNPYGPFTSSLDFSSIPAYGNAQRTCVERLGREIVSFHSEELRLRWI